MEKTFEQLGKHRSLKLFPNFFKLTFPCSFRTHGMALSAMSQKVRKTHLHNPKGEEETLFSPICILLGCFLLGFLPGVCLQRSRADSLVGAWLVPRVSSSPSPGDAAICLCTLTFSLAALAATHKFCFFSARSCMASDDKRLILVGKWLQ